MRINNWYRKQMIKKNKIIFINKLNKNIKIINKKEKKVKKLINKFILQIKIKIKV